LTKTSSHIDAFLDCSNMKALAYLNSLLVLPNLMFDQLKKTPKLGILDSSLRMSDKCRTSNFVSSAYKKVSSNKQSEVKVLNVQKVYLPLFQKLDTGAEKILSRDVV
jgi:hypothetical protein